METLEIKEQIELLDNLSIHGKYSGYSCELKELKSRYSESLRRDKSEYVHTKVTSSSNASKTVWNIVKSECNRQRHCKSNANIEIFDNGKLIHDPQNIVEIFANYFKNLPAQTIAQITKTDSTHSPLNLLSTRNS